MAKMTAEVYGKLTEGELFVAKYLHAIGIRFDPQHRIEVNRGSRKGHRIIDFYLPEFDVYLEYNGQWDVNEWHRNRYREKRNELLDNGLTLVEIYPNQLGIIEYSFPVKMIQTLSEGHRANGFLSAFKWKLVKGHKQWPDASDWIILGLINAALLVDFGAWVFSLPFTALVLGVKSSRLSKYWKELSAYERQSNSADQATGFGGIVEKCLEDLKAHGLQSSDHQLLQFLKGQNTSYFTELLEARGFGYFQHLSNEEVLSIIRDARTEGAQPMGFKSQDHQQHGEWLASIRDEVKNRPLVMQVVNEDIQKYRRNFRRSHEPWNDWEIQLLQQAFSKTQDIHVLADVFERSKGAIQSRLDQLN